MSHVGQGLQDVVGHCKQEVGGEKPAEAEDAVAHWQRDGEESTKTREESSEVTAAQTSRHLKEKLETVCTEESSEDDISPPAPAKS